MHAFPHKKVDCFFLYVKAIDLDVRTWTRVPSIFLCTSIKVLRTWIYRDLRQCAGWKVLGCRVSSTLLQSTNSFRPDFVSTLCNMFSTRSNRGIIMLRLTLMLSISLVYHIAHYLGLRKSQKGKKILKRPFTFRKLYYYVISVQFWLNQIYHN